MNNHSRNYGIDLLRTLSMFGVVILHVLGHGGILRSAQSLTDYSMIMFLEVLAFPAVNCFVLISGYLGYRGDRYFPKIKNLLSLFFVVLFYSVSIPVFIKLVTPSAISKYDLIMAFMPVTQKQYWFFTAYVGLFLLSPMVNIFVHKANQKQILAFLIVFALSTITSLAGDIFDYLDGYSVIWFVFLYTIGAIIRKYNWINAISLKKWILIIVAAFLITWLSKVALNYINYPLLKAQSSILILYTSPTMVLIAIGWLCIFAKIKCSNFLLSIMNFCAPSAFSVYLIHDNKFVRSYLISNIHKFAEGYGTLLLALFIICCVVGIIICCLMLDKFRIILFRLVKVDRISDKIANLLHNMMNALCNKMNIKP